MTPISFHPALVSRLRPVRFGQHVPELAQSSDSTLPKGLRVAVNGYVDRNTIKGKYAVATLLVAELVSRQTFGVVISFFQKLMGGH